MASYRTNETSGEQNPPSGDLSTSPAWVSDYVSELPAKAATARPLDQVKLSTHIMDNASGQWTSLPGLLLQDKDRPLPTGMPESHPSIGDRDGIRSETPVQLSDKPVPGQEPRSEKKDTAKPETSEQIQLKLTQLLDAAAKGTWGNNDQKKLAVELIANTLQNGNLAGMRDLLNDGVDKELKQRKSEYLTAGQVYESKDEYEINIVLKKDNEKIEDILNDLKTNQEKSKYVDRLIIGHVNRNDGTLSFPVGKEILIGSMVKPNTAIKWKANPTEK